MAFTQKNYFKLKMKSLFKAMLKVIFFLMYPVLYGMYFLYYRQKKIIIIVSFNIRQYNRNTRYIFEYLSLHTNHNVFWLTSSGEVRSYLSGLGYGCLYTRNMFKVLLYLFFSEIIISPGNNYYDPLNIVRKKAKKIFCGHGSGPKLMRCAEDFFIESLLELNSYRKFDYVNFPSLFTMHHAGFREYLVPKSRLINLSYPRNDQFFDAPLVEMRKKDKPELKYLLGTDMCDFESVLLYTPTWRSWSYLEGFSCIPIECIKDFSWGLLDAFLRSKNMLLVISLHTLNNYPSLPRKSHNIYIIENEKKPLFDITAFMMEVDVLINDYSTTTTDFCLLGRPQIFVMPDYEQYNHEKGFLEDYKSVIPGKEVISFEELLHLISLYVMKPEVYVQEYSEKIESYLEKYYDSKSGDSCERFSAFVDRVI